MDDNTFRALVSAASTLAARLIGGWWRGRQLRTRHSI